MSEGERERLGRCAAGWKAKVWSTAMQKVQSGDETSVICGLKVVAE